MKALVPQDPQAVALLRLDRAALPQYITRAQVAELVVACRNDRDRLFVRIGFETGGRVSELLGITRSDVDLSNRQIRLRTLKRRRDKRRRSEEVFRWIPVSHSLCADLAAYYLEKKTVVEAQALDLEFFRRHDRLFPFTRQAAFKLIRAAARRAHLVARGGRDVSPHILRHSFAMNCLTQGVPINVVKEMLGHSSIINTMIYLKTDPAEAREFLSKVQF
jgi:integrase/recombinase XerD